ncbi:cytochrome c-type biogenesis protein CcmH [Pelomonas sp. P7]|uniref:Cytochrome c-type biogenesis protein n=1 Tax=Pelomonas caseinilytica TaxID=2906763 RepID=A0ABS8XB33_9BURK|nr:cytochrome c-type biogenesis protein [Pelomonas sp. P7]MCE4536026.1 cytochrome c-type biogenesis protein CcmH [Pelomonas sp. P7]
MKAAITGRQALWLRAAVVALLALASLVLQARAQAQTQEAQPTADDPALEARMLALTAELRCLVCQNQTVADSHAALAVDLRNQVREMLRKGASDDEVMRYMTDRYGDFVRYRPPLQGRTALLWAGPAVLALGGLAGLLWHLRRRQQWAESDFEPDPETPETSEDAHVG